MTRRPPRLAVAALLVLSLVGAGCGGGGDSGSTTAAGPGAVRVVDNRFVPKTLTIGAGDTVTWSFEGAVKHNVSGPGFKSELQESGTFERTFDAPGTVDYVCTIHPGMVGKIVVE